MRGKAWKSHAGWRFLKMRLKWRVIQVCFGGELSMAFAQFWQKGVKGLPVLREASEKGRQRERDKKYLRPPQLDHTMMMNMRRW